MKNTLRQTLVLLLVITLATTAIGIGIQFMLWAVGSIDAGKRF